MKRCSNIFETRNKYVYLGIGSLISFGVAMLSVVILLPFIMINFSNVTTSNNEFTNISLFFPYYVTFVCVSIIGFMCIYHVGMMDELSKCAYVTSFIGIFICTCLFWSAFGCSLYATIVVPKDLQSIPTSQRIESEISVCFLLFILKPF